MAHSSADAPRAQPRLDKTHGFLRQINNILSDENRQEEAAVSLPRPTNQDTPIGRRMRSLEDYLREFPPEYHALVTAAARDPRGIGTHEMEQVLWAMFVAGLQGVRGSRAAAALCRLIVEGGRGNEVLTRLNRECVQAFQHRHRLFPDPSNVTEAPVHWTGFVYFVAALVAELGGGGMAEVAGSVTYAVVQNLARIMCMCGLVILRAPSLGHESEIECLEDILIGAGEAAEVMAPGHVKMLMRRVEKASLPRQGLSNPTRNTLVWLRELHASGWSTNASRR